VLTWRQRGPFVLLDSLTWQSRRVRLIPNPDTADGEVRVSRVVVCRSRSP
jgi:hypothetical protein